MVIESMRPKKKQKSIFDVWEDMHLPYFTSYTWGIMALVGAISGIAGGMLYSVLMSQFCK